MSPADVPVIHQAVGQMSIVSGAFATSHHSAPAEDGYGTRSLYIDEHNRSDTGFRQMAKRRLQARLEVKTDQGAVLGATRIRLLEAIDKHGSIAQAARRVPLSYKAAWDALDDLNNLADHPVIERSVGGAGGGGTRLTDYGRRLVAMFRAIEHEYAGVIDQVYARVGEADAADAAAFQRLLRRISLSTSARNQFACRVTRILPGSVSAQVHLALDENCELQAMLTNDSVADLRLAPGAEVLALVKAQAVFLLGDAGVRTSVSNHLSGIVSRIQRGPVNSEISVDLPLRHTRHVTAVVTSESVAALGLEIGSPVTAAFQASSVILAILD